MTTPASEPTPSAEPQAVVAPQPSAAAPQASNPVAGEANKTQHSFVRSRIGMAVVGISLVALAVVAGVSLYGQKTEIQPAAQPASGAASGSAANANAAAAMNKVVAVVNGKNISESELAPMVLNGVDRAIAVDRYVNKVLAADLARKAYPKDSDDALRGAEREVLSQFYVAKRTEDLQAAVTEAEIKAYYDKNVKSEDFRAYKVKVLVTQDPKEATEVRSQILAGKTSEVASKFKPAKDTGDGFLMAGEFPYGLGGVVQKLEKGKYSEPIPLRTGIYMFFMEDMKQNEKPDLAKVSTEIRSLIVAGKLNDELKAARQAANVVLKQ